MRWGWVDAAEPCMAVLHLPILFILARVILIKDVLNPGESVLLRLKTASGSKPAILNF